MTGINVPIGPAIVEYGEGAEMVTFDITKGGIKFTSSSTKQDITVDQYGDTVVKSIFKGGTAQADVPFALYDLQKLSKVTPNSTYVENGAKKKLEVRGKAGLDLLANAKKLVIKPTDPNTTPNDWVTIPLAGAMVNHEYAYDSDNERITPVTFIAYPEMDKNGLLFILGDETATPSA
jgi:hypothetical protein